MHNTVSLFTKEKAEALAKQNTAEDGEWTYKAEPTQGDASSLYQVAIYDSEGQKIGTL